MIRAEYGNDIAFAYRKGKLKPGDLYCIIIGEHCYDTERYFNKITFTCDCCGTTVTTYIKRPICFEDWTIRNILYGIEEYKDKRFCSDKCKQLYLDRERHKLCPDEDREFFVSRDMFTEKNTAGYIYKISKKSTGEFYVGQTIYVPIFRWGQHLKTERFDIKGILDYQFEVIEIVPKGENILEREKYWIQKLYLENPTLSLNISCTANLNPNQLRMELPTTKTVACVGSQEDFRKRFGVDFRSWREDIDTDFISITCTNDCAGKRFDSVLMICEEETWHAYENLFNECVARCKQ